MQSLGHTGTKTHTGSLERQAVPKMEVISGVTEQQGLGAASCETDEETTFGPRNQHQEANFAGLASDNQDKVVS